MLDRNAFAKLQYAPIWPGPQLLVTYWHHRGDASSLLSDRTVERP